jgi:succinyl-diaminopimelate desuccinylase
MSSFDLLSKQSEILELANELLKIPAISIGDKKNDLGIIQCYKFIVSYLERVGLKVLGFTDKKGTPGIYCDLSGNDEMLTGKILFVGHYDRVSPISDDQMVPKIEDKWLWARGATDMICTLATFMVLLKDLKIERVSANCGLLLVGNEEPGEIEEWGTPHILHKLKERYGYQPEFVIVGERTGDGPVNIGKVEYRGRGLIRIIIRATGIPGHTAQLSQKTVIERIIDFRNEISRLLAGSRNAYWKTTFTVPFFKAGELENFNTAPQSGIAGLEIRPIPEDDFSYLIDTIDKLAKNFSLEISYVNKEPGIITGIENPYVQRLLKTLVMLNGGGINDYLGNGKLHATQARFIKSPVVVFGQSGIDPHGPNERHYIPSIIPYYKAIREFVISYSSSF